MNSRDGTRHRPTTDGSIHFRLVAVRVGIDVDVQLRNTAERWVSVSDSSGHEVTGIGSTARAAVVASLDWLGPAAVAELLADLCLLDVSRQIRDRSTG
jgi:hypothetical protein